MKGVNIADLKAHLSEHLRHVRRGHELTVLDRSTPVARLVPYGGPRGGLRIRKSRGAAALGEIPVPPALDLGLDALELLKEERQGDR